MPRAFANRNVVQLSAGAVISVALLLISSCSATSMGATAAPGFTPTGGSFTSSQTVTVSDSMPGAILYCTTDGSIPTPSSPRCGQPVTVYKSETLSAIAVAPGGSSSPVTSATFTISPAAAEAPVISPSGGTFTAAQTVTLSDATEGATIYYTTDGSAPTTLSPVYGGPFTVSNSETINAIAVSPATTLSGVATVTFTINLPAPTPLISPAGGTYTSIQTVSITDAAAGATIYYTTDGTAPTTSSAVYSGAISVAKSETIEAIAIAPGSSVSAAASAVFTLNLPAASTPVISPTGGTFTSVQSVTITDSTAGSTIYYTTDGTTPTTSSAVYSGAISVSKSQSIKAIATATGFSTSAVATGSFTINLTASTPAFSPSSGTFTAIQTVSLSDATAGTIIYYTTDGTTPTTASTKYVVPITVATSETIKAIATASGYLNSTVGSATFTLNLPPAATPVISPAGGTFTTSQTVSITDSTPSATIYYTVDGTTPTTASPRYTAPLAVDASETLKSIAIATGYSASPAATVVFTFNQSAAVIPVISPAGGTFTSTQTVTISDSTTGATIYYTTDGTVPSTSSTKYTAGIPVSSSQTIKAVAAASAHNNSPIASATFTFPTATPTISPNGGTFGSAQTVTLSDTTAGATIYYTADGSTPNTTSSKYTAPFSVSQTETIKAIATTPGSSNSAVASAAFTISIITGIPLNGNVTSGSTPIVGSEVQLYAAGTTGYGSAPTALLTSPVTTGSTGAFALGYTCPAAPGDQLYLVATGGAAAHGNNSDIALMTALGSCSSLKSGASVTINEVTTVASVYALSAFTSRAPTLGIDIGAPAPTSGCSSTGSATCNYTGMVNAFKTAGNLVSSDTGNAFSITPFYSANSVPFLNTSTVPQARINTLADILSSCIDASSAANCPSLFTDSTPTGGTAPTDTLQAVLNVAQNPGQNVSKLFGLVGSKPIYTPALSAAPNDFALAITYTGAGLGIAAGGSTSQISDTGIAVDTAGNIWVTAYNKTQSSLASSMIAQFNNLGEAITPATTESTANPPVVTYGGYIPGNTTATAMAYPYDVAMDQSGALWVPGIDGLSEINPALSIAQDNLSTFVNDGNTKGDIIDVLGNVWVAAGTHIVEYSNAGTLLSPTGGWNGKSNIDNAGYQFINHLTFDSTGQTLWASDHATGQLYQISTTDGKIQRQYPGSYTPLVADGSKKVYGCVTGGGTSLNVYQSTSSTAVNTYSIATTRGCGSGPMIIDGAAHIFASTSTGYDEFTTSGTVLSPLNKGYTATSTGESTVFKGPAAAAIDGSGNLWSVNLNTGSVGVQVNVLTELVGIAAPVLTPQSLALQNGELATRP